MLLLLLLLLCARGEGNSQRVGENQVGGRGTSSAGQPLVGGVQSPRVLLHLHRHLVLQQVRQVVRVVAGRVVHVVLATAAGGHVHALLLVLLVLQRPVAHLAAAPRALQADTCWSGDSPSKRFQRVAAVQASKQGRPPAVGERVVPPEVGGPGQVLVHLGLDHLVEDPVERVGGRQGLPPRQLETRRHELLSTVGGRLNLGQQLLGDLDLDLGVLLLGHHHRLRGRDHLLHRYFPLPHRLAALLINIDLQQLGKVCIYTKLGEVCPHLVCVEVGQQGGGEG